MPAPRDRPGRESAHDWLERIRTECHRSPCPRRHAGYGAAPCASCPHPDPLCFLYAYPDVRDREIAGLLASALAYGNVKAILRSVGRALAPLGPHPAARVRAARSRGELEGLHPGFRHRWTTGADLAQLLWAARELLLAHGSLEAAFARGMEAGDRDASRGLSRFVREIRRRAPGLDGTGLLPDPADGSACKRLQLYLRWMVRCDEVDPGGWTCLRPAQLLIPLDVHVFRIAKTRLHFTRRAQPDLKAALEITRRFAELAPEDPLRYDYSLSHWGMSKGDREERGQGSGFRVQAGS